MKKRGFTLIEMLIVIIIIGILAATLIPRIGNARDRANDVARVADIKSIATALTSWGLDHTSYTANTISDSDLVGPNYGLGGVMPTDPVGGASYSYKNLGSDHFVVCATMSSASSNNGNAAKDIAKEEAVTDYNGAIGMLSDGPAGFYCYVG